MWCGWRLRLSTRRGNAVPDYPLQYAVFTRTPPNLVAPGAAAFVEPDGAFVAERAGLHTVVVSGGRAHRPDLPPRRPPGHQEGLGRSWAAGPVRDRHTSDLWVWEGLDGRDYAVTGTWGADGHAYFWDVTDPSSIHLVDTVRVNARTVNDVKVSPDGKFAVISREGSVGPQERPRRARCLEPDRRRSHPVPLRRSVERRKSTTSSSPRSTSTRFPRVVATTS